MTGTYKTSDDSLYEVTLEEKASDRTKGKQYIARCIQSKTKTDTPFFLSKENLERNTLFKLWMKIP